MSFQNHVHDGVEYELELNLTSSTGTYVRRRHAGRTVRPHAKAAYEWFRNSNVDVGTWYL